MEYVLDHASQLYTFEYFGIIVLVSALECFIPRQPAGDELRLRWFSNIVVTILDSIVVRLLFPMLGLGLAIYCAKRHWGLFNVTTSPQWLQFAVMLLVLDLLVYAQHYSLHHFSLLWRLHRSHHTDQAFDFTTGLRFHPFESILTTGVNLGAIALLGPAPAAIFVYQLLVTLVAIFQHGNLRLPSSFERMLRHFLVTPDVHRIHHSLNARESMTNFGDIFPWWDRLFATYLDLPAAGQDNMNFGSTEFPGRRHLKVQWMLVQPFLRPSPGISGNENGAVTDGAAVFRAQV